MSEAAQEVARLRGDLEREQDRLAAARGAAERAASRLQVEPTRERQQERDEALGEVELIDLNIRRLEGELAAASEADRQAGIAELLAGHAEQVQALAQTADQRLHEGLSIVEDALGQMMSARNKTRSTTGQLLQLGYPADQTPQIAVRPDREVARRLERLAADYARCMRPVMG